MENKMLYLIVPFCSIFILIGGGLMISAGRKIVLGIEAKSWPQVNEVFEGFKQHVKDQPFVAL